MIKQARQQLTELNERLASGESYETVLLEIYDTDEESYADFNCESFSGTYSFKHNKIMPDIDIWKKDEEGNIIGYHDNVHEEKQNEL